MERDNLGIQSRYNGSKNGEGVYTADTPYSYMNRYGPVCLLVARLVGINGTRDDGVDTVVNYNESMKVLKTSSQCFPAIFSFEQSLLEPETAEDSNGGYNLVILCHVQVQKILDEFLNEGCETPIPNILVPNKMYPQAPSLRGQMQRQRGALVSCLLENVGVAECEVCHIQTVERKKTVHTYTAPHKILDKELRGKSPSARMEYFKDDTLTCQGYVGCGTILIKYIVKADKQKSFHPDPNELHDSLQRLAFLPDNKEGNELLKRLEAAFLEGWTFQVNDQKLHPSAPNSIDWMTPHKTILATGFDGYAYTEKVGRAASGFPDSTFFGCANVALETLQENNNKL